MLRIVSVTLCCAAALTSMPVSAGSCYADWSIAAPIVRKEGLTSVEVLSRLAETRISGDIVKTTLCEEKGGFVYRLVIRDLNGRFQSRTVDARTPFAP
jgi:uncharacterized membrane protein YkoI